MSQIRLAEVLEATGGRLQAPRAPRRFSSFHTDSRTVLAGGLFFALRGARTDGHRFVEEAVRAGAAGVVVSEPVTASGAAVISVSDTWRALYDLARARLREAAPLVVGITGSNGKTSTKEMVAAVLQERYQVLKTEGNLNTETGVPLTILGLEPGHHGALVLEMGMQGPGEIARLAGLARPRVGVVTVVGSVHMEFFSSREALARAKGELIQALPPDGLAVLNAEDRFTPLLRELSAAPVVTFGLDAGDLRAQGYRRDGDAGVVSVRGVQLRLRLPGRHQARNALAALAVGEFAGVPLERAALAMAQLQLEHRLQQILAPGGYRLVDDSYNASPESMLAAFETVAEAPRSGRLLAVLGEMRELGPVAEEEHRRLGRVALNTFDQVCVIRTGWGQALAEAAGADVAADTSAAERWVRNRARPGDVILVKASRGLALDQLVARLLVAR